MGALSDIQLMKDQVTFIIRYSGYLPYQMARELGVLAKKRRKCHVCDGTGQTTAGTCILCDGAGKRSQIYSDANLDYLCEIIISKMILAGKEVNTSNVLPDFDKSQVVHKESS